ncbi:MAG: hypothetical protein PHV34_06440 [Verrucomicrobiae bacterium]|nr:hypothetical protein [Verrucomicrobiae bacterium]
MKSIPPSNKLRENAGEKTAAEHLDYLESGIRLMLWFAWNHCRKHPEETFDQVINRRLDIFRRTSLNQGELHGSSDGAPVADWNRLVEKLSALQEQTKNETESGAFEHEAMRKISPLLPSRVERDLQSLRERRFLAEFQCGSLRHNAKPQEDAPKRIGFHIANACYPASLFDDPHYLPQCLMSLMEKTEKTFGVTELGTGTWLNSHPRWLELFPPKWGERMSPPAEIAGNLGTWGQFMTARQTFNHKLAAKFRQSGELPFPSRTSWCSMESLRNHLAACMAKKH